MNSLDWRIKRLTQDTVLDTSFDCGNTELNGFLLEDAKDYQKRHLATTYIAASKGSILGYFSLSNDKMDLDDSDKPTWRRIKASFPYSKHRKDYPAIKIGRFGIDRRCQKKRLGSILINLIKEMFSRPDLRSGCTFLTVDALQEAIPFYQKNGFKRLSPSTAASSNTTELLYYDLSQLF